MASFSAAALAASTVGIGQAEAAKPTSQVSYSVAGSTAVKSIGTTVPLGPSTLRADLSADGTFTGDLALPTQTVSFVYLDIIVVSAQLDFIPVGRVTGALHGGKKITVQAVAQYRLRLSNLVLNAGGFLNEDVGDTCESTKPVTIPVATPAGNTFNLNNGGTLTGGYTIGQFSGCANGGDGLINLVVPGSGNTVSLTLSKGRMTQPAALHTAYPVTGSNTITGVDHQVATTTALGATSMRTIIGRTGTLSASLPLPLEKLSFSFAGKEPVTAQLKFIRQVKLTGTFTGAQTGTVTATGQYAIRINKLIVGGNTIDTGPKCQTQRLVSLHLASPAKKQFDRTRGGSLTGTYTIGTFVGCGDANARNLVNGIFPNTNNTMTLTATTGTPATHR